MNEQKLQEFLRQTLPICRQFEDSDYWVDHSYLEPNWMRKERIRLSLPAMTEFILDDSILSWDRLDNRSENSPLFLQLNPSPGTTHIRGWGRKVWIQDLGLMEYRPAFDALREVWLHDRGNHYTIEDFYNPLLQDFYAIDIPKAAFLALARLKDERILGDIRDKLKEPDTLANESTILNYLNGLENFKCDYVVAIIMDFADILRGLHPGKRVSRSGHYNALDDHLGISVVSPVLRKVLFTLHHIDTEKARNAMKQIISWFPRDAMLRSAYNDLLYLSGQREERKPEIIKPEGYGEPLVGSREVDIFNALF